MRRKEEGQLLFLLLILLLYIRQYTLSHLLLRCRRHLRLETILTFSRDLLRWDRRVVYHVEYSDVKHVRNLDINLIEKELITDHRLWINDVNTSGSDHFLFSSRFNTINSKCFIPTMCRNACSSRNSESISRTFCIWQWCLCIFEESYIIWKKRESLPSKGWQKYHRHYLQSVRITITKEKKISFRSLIRFSKLYWKVNNDTLEN